MIRKDIDESEMIKLYNDGYTVLAISMILKCSKNTISRRLKKNGIKPKSTDARRWDKVENKKFGMLTVLSKVTNPNSVEHKCICKCDCGKIIEIKRGSLTGNYVKSCGCLSHRTGENNPLYKGYKEIPGKFWSTLQREAKERNKEFLLTIEYIYELFIQQNKKCALSGLPIVLDSNSEKRTASLDRIDSKIGYIPGNVEWIHKKINLMKHRYEKQEFIKLCKTISEYNK